MKNEGHGRQYYFHLRLLQLIGERRPLPLRDLLALSSGPSFRHCLKFLLHYEFVALERAECVNRRYVLTRKGEEYLELLTLSVRLDETAETK